MNETLIKASMAQQSVISHTPRKASMNDAITPSHQPSGSFFRPSRPSSIRGISSEAPEASPNRPQSLSFNVFWYIADAIVIPTVPPMLRARTVEIVRLANYKQKTWNMYELTSRRSDDGLLRMIYCSNTCDLCGCQDCTVSSANTGQTDACQPCRAILILESK